MAITGPDVSSYQGHVDWKQVKAAGHDFAFIKATEGLSYRNPTFAREWPAIKAAGLVRGAYHFGRPQLSARKQANYFIDTLGGWHPGDLPPVLDIEVTDGRPAAAVRQWIKEFVDEVHRLTGVKPIIYTGGPFWKSNVGLDDNMDCPLWLAAYVNNPKAYVPDAWSTYTFWQYTSSAVVPGIGGRVDMSIFNGDQLALRKLTHAQGHEATKKPAAVSSKTRSNAKVLARVLKLHPEWRKRSLAWLRQHYSKYLNK